MALKIDHSVNVDFTRKNSIPVLHMKQGDEGTREITVHFFNNGTAYAVPDDATLIQISYAKSDGIGGAYDTLPDEETAAGEFSNDRKSCTVQLVGQVLNVPGFAYVEVKLLTNAKECLNTGNLLIDVEKSPFAMTSASEGYYRSAYDGATFTPHISEDGVLSWTNDKDLENPPSINLYDVLKTGNLSDLETTEKSTLVAAINEVLNACGSGTDENAVHYTADEEKTDEQKTAARNNIGAYAKPAGGIPQPDLSADVQDALAKAGDAQPLLIAGRNITIDPSTNTISANGGLQSVSGIDIEGAKLDNYYIAESANVARGKLLDYRGNEQVNASYLYFTIPRCASGHTYRSNINTQYSVIAEDSNGGRSACTYGSTASGAKTFTVPASDDRIVKIYFSTTIAAYDAVSAVSVIDITDEAFQNVFVPWLIAKSAKNVVQTEGDSEEAAMSQKATTNLLSSKIGRCDVLDALNIGAEPNNFFVDYTGRTPNPIQYNKVIDLSTHKIRDQAGYLVFPMTLYSGRTYNLNRHFAITNRIYGNAFSLFNNDGTVTSIAVTDGTITVPVVESQDIVTIYGSMSNGNYNNSASLFVCELDGASSYSGEKHLVPWIKTGNRWAGKNYLVIGDSVSAGTAPTGESYSVVTETFSKIASDNLAMKLMNTAVQGRTVRTTLKTAQTGQSVMQAAIDAGFTPDLITILLGFNDYAAISRGEMTLGSDEDVYTTPETCSYYAGLREIVRICQTTWKEATIIILTSNKCVKYHSKGHEVQTIKDIEAVKREIAENFGVLFFDWTNICGFNTENADIVSYFRLDSIHPNREAHRVLGNRLTGFISSV